MEHFDAAVAGPDVFDRECGAPTGSDRSRAARDGVAALGVLDPDAAGVAPARRSRLGRVDLAAEVGLLDQGVSRGPSPGRPGR